MAVSAAESANSPERGQRGGWVGSIPEAVRRYWWLVFTVAFLGVIGGFVATALTPPTYTGRTSLIVSSNGRSPDQDAVLVQGYVVYFNDLPYQRRLLADAGIDGQVTLEAAAAAASPIVVISATAADPDSAQTAAIAVATAFKEDINKTHDQRVAADLASLQDQLDTALGRKNVNDQALVSALQEQIRELRGDQDNILQELQSLGGVSAQPPSWLTNVGLGLVGGLLLGGLAAVTLAAVSPRLRSWRDVKNKVGLNTLIELPEPRSKDAPLRREKQLRQLANRLRARLAGPGVVAVTQTIDGFDTRRVAAGLAMEWATQGYPTILVRFGQDPMSPSRSDRNATAPLERVEVATAVSWVSAGPVPGLSILDLGAHLADNTRGLPLIKLPELLQLEPLVGAFVVLDTPALAGSVDAQSASLAADVTILVIDTKSAQVNDAREAVGLLRQLGVVLLGAVLTPPVTGEKGRAYSCRGERRARQPGVAGKVRASSTARTDPSRWPTSNGPVDSVQPRRALNGVAGPAQIGARNDAANDGIPTGNG